MSDGTTIVLSYVNTAVQTQVFENIKPSLIFVQSLQTSNERGSLGVWSLTLNGECPKGAEPRNVQENSFSADCGRHVPAPRRGRDVGPACRDPLAQFGHETVTRKLLIALLLWGLFYGTCWWLLLWLCPPRAPCSRLVLLVVLSPFLALSVSPVFLGSDLKADRGTCF